LRCPPLAARIAIGAAEWLIREAIRTPISSPPRSPAIATRSSALLQRHYGRIHGLAWQLTGSRADADDIAQDVCCVLVEKIASFRGEAKFSTWLCGIVFNACRDLRRRRRSFGGLTERLAVLAGLARGPDGRDLHDAIWVKSAIARPEARLSRNRGARRRPAAHPWRGGGDIGRRGGDDIVADARGAADARGSGTAEQTSPIGPENPTPFVDVPRKSGGAASQ
jgi:hypothetical protein